jgi:hypothetical protein
MPGFDLAMRVGGLFERAGLAEVSPLTYNAANSAIRAAERLS